ncbi:MAG TPA: divalent-cation tolerance protein CutA [Terriglobales bacterium]|jgi:periplasmic divalent cation tolerance protein|nr:divalent-cation tolerance protein CutA [Terriglobales bacterium]
MTDKKIVLTTTGTREEAGKIARSLVERRLAACVNVVEIESVYRWKEAVESAEEWLLLIKTTAEAFAQVQAAIQELHTYDLPECVVLPIENGSEDYLAWIGESVSEP